MILCEMLDLQVNPDGSTIAVPCRAPAVLRFRDPACPCCINCFTEVFYKGNVLDLGGVRELEWVYF